MSSARLAEITQIKEKLPLPALFAEYFPDHYRHEGLSFCPFHDDRTASLELKRDRAICYGACSQDGRGKAYDVFHLYQKRYSCDFKTAKRALSERCGISTGGQARTIGRITATYPYHDETGTLLYEVVRYTPKDFKQRRPTGLGGWAWNLEGVRRVLYRLPEVVKADEVWIAEGEKDADSLSSLGLCGTTSPQGAGKWKGLVEKFRIQEPLKEKTVYLLPDNDDTGRNHAQDVARSLHEFAASVKIIELPGLPDKGDSSNFIQEHGPEEAKTLLLELAEKAPEYEPTTTDEARGEESAENETRFTKLLNLFYSTGAETFLDQHNAAWICVNLGGVRKNVRIGSSEFARILLNIYFDTYRAPVSKQTIEDVGNLLEARATEIRPLYNRLAWTNDGLYIDMATPSWEAIRVDQAGWKIVKPEKPPFKRFNHQQPLPLPEKGGNPNEILNFLPIKDDKAKLLIVVWLVAAFIENIPRPGIILHGLQGSGKSTVCEFLRDVVDPSSTPTLSLSKDAAEFVQMMSHHAVICLDNLHKLPQWASDDLCRAVTGSGFSKRQLYSDDSDVIYQFSRTFILNGISVPGSSPDLMDRSILLELDRVKEHNRRERAELLEVYRKARPRILGGILEALSRAMDLRDSIRLNRLPRMADFTVWGCAVAEALGIGQDFFLDAYYSNINFQHEEITTSEPVCMALIDFFKDRTDWQGTPSDLYEALKKNAESLGIDKSSRWPKAAHVLTRYLNQFNHNLAQIGIEIRMQRDGRTRTLLIQNGQRETLPEIPSQGSERHTANDSGQLYMTHSMTLSDGRRNTVTRSVTHNLSEPLNNDASDSNDAICGSPQTSESQGYMSRLSTWGCTRCTNLDETAEYVLCRVDGEPLDLTTPDAFCRKLGSQQQATTACYE